jgi:hypothetical protein
MEMTLLLSKIVGPVLILRAISILIDRKHFESMICQIEGESQMVAFSMFPIAMLMSGIAIAVTHTDTSSVAAILFHLIAWGMIIKTSLLILFPRLLARKLQLLPLAGFLNLVFLACSVVGVYLTWFGYFASVSQ